MAVFSVVCFIIFVLCVNGSFGKGVILKPCGWRGGGVVSKYPRLSTWGRGLWCHPHELKCHIFNPLYLLNTNGEKKIFLISRTPSKIHCLWIQISHSKKTPFLKPNFWNQGGGCFETPYVSKGGLAQNPCWSIMGGARSKIPPKPSTWFKNDPKLFIKQTFKNIPNYNYV